LLDLRNRQIFSLYESSVFVLVCLTVFVPAILAAEKVVFTAYGGFYGRTLRNIGSALWVFYQILAGNFTPVFLDTFIGKLKNILSYSVGYVQDRQD